ncbi:class II glutamine amidotransferase [Nocardia goodfellowii]|uniref:Gamma-glutamyl-hercynylcysteine sulfoxide hydrolase n=1 Tax=Nocardia goodfellowii TaxID=882446 RepID=A0ABS4QBK4_9NOCA|nr:class II glutamine amidotransferase [Nocardia goodfellowii]MBP2189081.1 glutamine amidotransferase [Nocardia goodfellowii]
MCRHAGYVGPEIGVGELLTRGAHSLRTQAWAPREMRGGGTINADGFGVAWWRAAESVPSSVTEGEGQVRAAGRGDTAGRGGVPDSGMGVRGGVVVSRYRNPAPIWTDPAVEEVLPQLKSTAVLASIRSATVGMPVERAACAPFLGGRWAFSHNGVVPGWRRVLTAVSSDLDTAATQWGATRLFETAQLLEAESATDSAALWVLLGDLLDSAGPEGFVESAGAALALLATTVLTHAPDARLNFLLGDGAQLWATTVHHALSALVTDDCAILSSEPYDDDPRWQPIPDRCLVTARPGHLSVEPLSQAGRQAVTP